MKIKTCNYLLALSPVFNKDRVPLFESFDRERSAILWQALYLNAFEVLSSFGSTSYILVLSESDKGYLPERIRNNSDNIVFGDLDDKELLFRNMNDKYFDSNENNIVFLSNSIGYSHQDISRSDNLLNTDDDTLVIARSLSGNLCFTGFNHYPDFLKGNKYDYDFILEQACRHNSTLFTISNFISVNNISDFKVLYSELSKKESLSYCSQAMHEQFTHLFIEYKDLLK